MARLLSLIPRLTAPLVVRGDGLPTFGKTARWPSEVDDEPSRPDPASVEEKKGVSAQQTYLSLTKTHNDDDENRSGSLAPGQSPPSQTRQEASSLQRICAQAAAKHRVIFFGEQHHQPKVLSAQLQVLYHVMQAAAERGVNVHVVFEHWSLDDQLELSSGELSMLPSGPLSKEKESQQRDATKTSEGFRRDHYQPLVDLVQEMHGTVWGGFPPREWARIVARGARDGPHEAFETTSSHPSTSALQMVQKLDQERYQRTLVAADRDASKVINPLPNDRYNFITNVGWAHRAYLKGMFNPDSRPPVSRDVHNAATPPEEHVGFVPAQALKDTFFAHSIASLLDRDKDCLVVAICGAGHCEWSFGAPERVQQMMMAGRNSEEMSRAETLRPYIFLSKPNDAGFWPEEGGCGRRDGVSVNVTSHVDETASTASRQNIPDDEQWQRKQADTILLYDWVD